jgi:hypothetical protein
METTDTTTASASRPAQCATCGAKTKKDGEPLSHCVQCRTTKYCSQDCQKKDWPTHKEACLPPDANEPNLQSTLKLLHEESSLYKDFDCPTLMEEGNAQELEQRSGVCMQLESIMNLDINSQLRSIIVPKGDPPNSFSASPIEWYPLKVPQALGFPLQFAVTGAGKWQNTKLGMLDLDIDPKSPTFGHEALPVEAVRNVLFTRTDQKEIHKAHLLALFAYVDQHLQEMTDAWKKEVLGEEVNKEEMVKSLLDREAFKTFFEEMKAAQWHREPWNWEGVECPVD